MILGLLLTCLALPALADGPAPAGGPALAAPAPAADAAGPVLTPEEARGLPVTGVEVVLTGMELTHPGSVLRLMDTREGRVFDPGDLAGDLARLRATSIIYDLVAVIRRDGPGVRLTLTMKDRWSLLPFFAFRRGGGRTFTASGAWDGNLGGRFVLLSVGLLSTADIPFIHTDPSDRLGARLIFQVPRLAGTRLGLQTILIREPYPLAGLDAAGEPALLFDRTRHMAWNEVTYDLNSWATLGLTTAVMDDGFALSGRSPQAGALPPDALTVLAGLRATVGVVDEELGRVEGTQLTATVEGARAGWLGSDLSVLTATLRLRHYRVPWEGHVLAFQLWGGATTGQTESHLLRAGGVAEVRGFLDSTFAGQLMARWNLEHRVVVFEGTWPFRTVLQLATFSDGGVVGRRALARVGLDYQGLFVSAGSGFRLHLVPFARTIGRLDFAFGLYPLRRFEVSLGVLQYF